MRQLIFGIVCFGALITVSRIVDESMHIFNLKTLAICFTVWSGIVIANIGFKGTFNTFKELFKVIFTNQGKEKKEILNNLYEICEEFHTTKRRKIKFANNFLKFGHDKIWGTPYHGESFGLSLMIQVEDSFQESLEKVINLKKMTTYFLVLNLVALLFAISSYTMSVFSNRFDIVAQDLIAYVFTFTFVSLFVAVGLLLPWAERLTDVAKQNYYKNCLIAFSLMLVKEHMSPVALYDEVKPYFDQDLAA